MRVLSMARFTPHARVDTRGAMVLIPLIVLPLLLAACAAVVPSQPARAPADRVATECRLLERAAMEAVQSGMAAPADILSGCPGHEALRATMTMVEMSASTGAANAAVAPATVQAMGARADMVYRRMITRGVPEAIAREMVQTPEFAAAVR